MKKLSSILAVPIWVIASILIIGGCTKENSSLGSTTSKGSVSISSVSAKYSRITGLGSITCTVTAYGVTKDEVKEIGFYYSADAFSKYNLGKRCLAGTGILSKSKTVNSMDIYSNKQYYVRGYLTTESGKVYSSQKVVKTN